MNGSLNAHASMPGKAVNLLSPPSFTDTIPPDSDRSSFKRVPDTKRYYNIYKVQAFQMRLRNSVPIKGQIKYNHTIHKFEIEISSLFYAYESLAEEIPKNSILQKSVSDYFSNLRTNYSESELKILFGELNPTKYYINDSDIDKFISQSKESIKQEGFNK